MPEPVPVLLWVKTPTGWVPAPAAAGGQPISVVYGISTLNGDPTPLGIDGNGQLLVNPGLADPLNVAVTGLPIIEGEVITATRERAVRISDLQPVNAGAYLNCYDGNSRLAKIINIFWEYDVDIEWYDGTHSIVIATETGAGGWFNLALYCDPDYYIRVKNRHATLAKNIGYNGILVPSDLTVGG